MGSLGGLKSHLWPTPSLPRAIPPNRYPPLTAFHPPNRPNIDSKPCSYCYEITWNSGNGEVPGVPSGRGAGRGANKGQFWVHNAGLLCCVAGQLVLRGYEEGCRRPFGGVRQQEWGELDPVASFMRAPLLPRSPNTQTRGL